MIYDSINPSFIILYELFFMMMMKKMGWGIIFDIFLFFSQTFNCFNKPYNNRSENVAITKNKYILISSAVIQVLSNIFYIQPFSITSNFSIWFYIYMVKVEDIFFRVHNKIK